MIKLFSKSVFVLVFMFIVYSPTIWLIIRPVPVYWIVTLLGFFLIAAKRRINSDIVVFGTIVIIMLLYYTFLMLMAGQTDNLIIANLLSSLGYVGAFYYFLGPWAVRIWGSVTGFYKVYCYAAVIHSLLVIFFFIFPDIRFSLHPYLYISDFGMDSLFRQWRGLGITSQSGETIAITHGIALFMIMRLLIKGEIGWVKATISFLIMFGALLLLNRLGMVVGLIGIFMALIMPGGIISRKIFALSSIAITFIIAAIFISSLPVHSSPRALRRSLEAYHTYQTEGRFTTSSTQTLFGRMLFIPEVPFVFGSGNFGRQGRLEYVPSDIGFVRLYHGAGFAGVLLWFTLVLFFLVNFNRGRESIALGFFLAIVWILSNIKVLWLTTPDGPAITVGILLFIRFYEKNRDAPI